MSAREALHLKELFTARLNSTVFDSIFDTERIFSFYSTNPQIIMYLETTII